MRKRKWTEKQLRRACRQSRSIRQILFKIGLKPAGGNYKQIDKYIKEYNIDCSHLNGKGWSKGLKGIGKPRILLKDILVKDSSFQSYKLKRRLFTAGIKNKHCEKCGWAKKSLDGRLPLELDHINGNHRDNRLKNLRVLCPNCHSLQLHYRGKNKKN